MSNELTNNQAKDAATSGQPPLKKIKAGSYVSMMKMMLEASMQIPESIPAPLLASAVIVDAKTAQSRVQIGQMSANKTTLETIASEVTIEINKLKETKSTAPIGEKFAQEFGPLDQDTRTTGEKLSQLMHKLNEFIKAEQAALHTILQDFSTGKRTKAETENSLKELKSTHASITAEASTLRSTMLGVGSKLITIHQKTSQNAAVVQGRQPTPSKAVEEIAQQVAQYRK